MNNTVATSRLSPVKSFICNCYKAVRTFLPAERSSYPDTDGGRNHCNIATSYCCYLDERTDPLRYNLSRGGICAGEDDQKLLPAKTPYEPRIGHRVCNKAPKALENDVACGMPVGVVKAFEIIEIENENRQELLVVMSAITFPFQQRHNLATVTKVGDRVNRSGMFERVYP